MQLTGGLQTVPCLPCMGHYFRQASYWQSNLASNPPQLLPCTACCIKMRPDRQDAFCRAKTLIWWCLVSTEVTIWAFTSFTLAQLVLQRKLPSRQAPHIMQALCAVLAMCCYCAPTSTSPAAIPSATLSRPPLHPNSRAHVRPLPSPSPPPSPLGSPGLHTVCTTLVPCPVCLCEQYPCKHFQVDKPIAG